MGKPELKQAGALLPQLPTQDGPSNSAESPVVETWPCLRCKGAFPEPAPKPALCPACFEIVAKERHLLRQGLVLEAMTKIGVPPKFLQQKFTLPEALEPRATGTLGVYLYGPEGVGKSFAITALLRERLLTWSNTEGRLEKTFPQAETWRWIDWPDFVADLQDSYERKGEESAHRKVKAVAAVPLLVIDDLGVEKISEASAVWTYRILDHREKWLLPTFITSNTPIEPIPGVEGGGHLDARYGVRISGRIIGCCDVQEMTGPSRRLPT